MDQSTQVQTILDQVSRLLSNVECLEYPSLGLEDITEGMSVVELVRWWDENWNFLLNGPDEADSWRDEEDEIPGSVDPEVVVDNLRQAIENLEPAGDAKGYYWDAIELNVDQQRLDDILDEYVESDHLSPEEREYIKQEDEPPPGT